MKSTLTDVSNFEQMFWESVKIPSVLCRSRSSFAIRMDLLYRKVPSLMKVIVQKGGDKEDAHG